MSHTESKRISQGLYFSHESKITLHIQGGGGARETPPPSFFGTTITGAFSTYAQSWFKPEVLDSVLTVLISRFNKEVSEVVLS